ncbi:MAG: TOBE domain-containing protein, partial [Nitrososphaerota archaeon]
LELYTNPASPFVASFIGTSNFLRGRLRIIDRDKGIGQIERGALNIKVGDCGPPMDGRDVLVSIRPEDIKLLRPDEAQDYLNVFVGRVQDSIFVGNVVRLNVTVDDAVLKIDVYGEDRLAYLAYKGEEVRIGFNKVTIMNL